MLEYLQTNYNLSLQDFVATIDEVTLWSAPFGLLLLDNIKLEPDMKVLDVGCGTGFPLLEIAQRLGTSSVVYGIDPWKAALKHVKKKIKNYKIKNVKLIEGSASSTNFKNDYFDIIVSNLGMNNFDHPTTVLKECFRIIKPKGLLTLTSNFTGHMQEFYDIFKQTLVELNFEIYLNPLQKHIEHRLNNDTICSNMESSGFIITKTITDTFSMRFLNGSTFFRHYFIKLGFLNDWKNIIADKHHHVVFESLEKKLNLFSAKHGELNLTIPFGFIEGKKPDIL